MVDYGKAGTGGIRSYYSRNNHDMLFLIKCRCFRSVYSRATPYTNNGIYPLLLHNFPHSVNFRFAGNTSKNLIVTSFIRSFKAFFQFVMTSFVGTMGADKKVFLPHISCFLTERKQCISSLNIFQRISHFSKFFHLSTPFPYRGTVFHNSRIHLFRKKHFPSTSSTPLRFSNSSYRGKCLQQRKYK